MHPLTGDLTQLSDDDLRKKLNELYARYRMSGNMRDAALMEQVRMMLEDYQTEYNRRIAKQAEEFANQNKKYADKIDIK